MQKLSNYTKLKRELFILKNIDVCLKSCVKEKEIAVKNFTTKYPDYTFYEVCRAINLSKGTYYNFLYHKKKITSYEEKDKLLENEVSDIFNQCQERIGSTKIKFELEKRGIQTSVSKIVKIMNKLNLSCKYSKPNKRNKDTTAKHVFKHNLLKRHFFQDKPNAVWVSDFTEIKIDEAKFYLCVILDLFSRKVIAYRTSCKNDLNIALNTFKDAFEERGQPKNLMFHSDQGAQYLSHPFQDTLKALGVIQSFSDPGTPYDNAVMESFFSTLKREEVYRKLYKNYDELVASIDEYMVFYNERRPHKTLNYKTPTEYEYDFYKLI